MKLSLNEIEKILKELEVRHYAYDNSKNIYKHIADEIKDDIFVQEISDTKIYTLNNINTCNLIEYNIIKIEDNVLKLNLEGVE